MYVLNFNDRVGFFFFFFFFFTYFIIFYHILLCAVLFSVNIILRTTLEISVR